MMFTSKREPIIDMLTGVQESKRENIHFSSNNVLGIIIKTHKTPLPGQYKKVSYNKKKKMKV